MMVWRSRFSLKEHNKEVLMSVGIMEGLVCGNGGGNISRMLRNVLAANISYICIYDELRDIEKRLIFREGYVTRT